MKFIYIIMLIPFLISCKGLKGDISAELEKTRKTIETSTDTIAKSVPGERYLRLIEGMANEETREQTKKLIENIFGVTVGKKTMINIMFGYELNNETGPLTGNAFFSRFNSSETVVAALKSNVIPSLQSVKNKVISPYTDIEIKNKTTTLLRAYFTNMFGHYDTSKIHHNNYTSTWIDGSLSKIKSIGGMNNWVVPNTKCSGATHPDFVGGPKTPKQYIDYFISEYECEIAKFQKPLIDALMVEYSQRPVNVGKGDIVKQWNYSQGRFLILVLNSKQFEAYKDKLTVSYIMQTLDENDKVIKQTDNVNININNFIVNTGNSNDLKKSITAPQLGTDLVWAAVNLDGNILTPAEFNYYVELDNLIKTLEELENRQNIQ